MAVIVAPHTNVGSCITTHTPSIVLLSAPMPADDAEDFPTGQNAFNRRSNLPSPPPPLSPPRLFDGVKPLPFPREEEANELSLLPPPGFFAFEPRRGKPVGDDEEELDLVEDEGNEILPVTERGRVNRVSHNLEDRHITKRQKG